MKSFGLALYVFGVIAHAQTKGFVQINTTSADRFWVVPCAQTSLERGECIDAGSAIFLGRNRIEPLKPGQYNLYTDINFQPKTFLVNLSKITNVLLESISVDDLFKMAPTLKNYVSTDDHSSPYSFVLTPDYNDIKNRKFIEDYTTSKFQAELKERLSYFCDKELTVADLARLSQVDICLNSKRRTIPVEKPDKETERFLDLLAAGFSLNSYDDLGQPKVAYLRLNWYLDILDISKSKESYDYAVDNQNFDRVKRARLQAEITDQPFYNLLTIDNQTELAKKTILLFPGNYVIVVQKKFKDDYDRPSYESVDALPFQIKE